MNRNWLFSKRIALGCTVILFFLVPEVYSQGTGVRPSSLSPELDSLFTRGRLAELEVSALRRLHRKEEYSEAEQIAATLYLGFLHVLQGDEQQAESEFMRTLTALPSLRLDPVYVPPRIYEVFERVRDQFEAETVLEQLPVDSGERQPTRSIEPYSPSTSSIIASLVSPGLGFIFEGKYVRGMFWTAVQAASTGYFVYALVETDRARDLYMTNTDPLLFDSRYEHYNEWYQKAWLTGSAAAAVYLLSEADFYFYWKRTRVEPAMTAIATPGNDLAPAIGFTITFDALR